MDLGAIRAAIRDALYDGTVEVTAYAFVPDNPVIPCVCVYPDRIEYDDTYDGTATATLTMWCIAGTVDAETAQTQMDGWISTLTEGFSIVVPVGDTDPTLGGAASSVRVLRMASYGVQVLGDQGTRYLMAEFEIEAMD
jgi:hypothetical protein